MYNRDENKSEYVDYASGCCLLMPRKVIERVGMWAEEYFMYYEDVSCKLKFHTCDFSYRVNVLFIREQRWVWIFLYKQSS